METYMINIIRIVDSYKYSHWQMYPKDTEYIYSYFESRNGNYENVLFFGLQYYLKKYLIGKVITEKMVDDAVKFCEGHFGNKEIFNKSGWEHILKNHQGKLPVEIKAVAEGTLVPIKNVLFTVENTCPQDFWLTSYLETLLSKIWYPCSVASRSYEMKKIIKKYLDLTGDNIPDYSLHDFGDRGSTSVESAGIGGGAHLLNFKGSDTGEAIEFLQEYYYADMPAFSIAASEHSTITSWGGKHEKDAFENILNKFPTGLVACVSDSYDIYNAVEKIWGEQLKDKIINRKGTLILRPDSGVIEFVLPKILNILGEKFGYTVNKKGYKILPSYIRLIQGDGINESTLLGALVTITKEGWSADNIAFGAGAGLLQKIDRDTMSFAYKTSSITINGKDYPVSKNPITDPKKKSKAGKLKLIKSGEKSEIYGDSPISYMTVPFDAVSESFIPDQLKTVYKNGELLIDQNFEDIRKRAEESL